MPTIPTYTAQIDQVAIGGGRRAQAEDFGLGPSRIGHVLQQGAESFLADKEDKESREALVSASQIKAKYARALDDAATTDADTAKIKEQMQNELSKVGEQFQTKKGLQALEHHTAQTELVFDDQANRIEVQRAAQQAHVEGEKFLNSAGAILQSNPTYLPVAEQDAEAFVGTLTKVAPGKRAEIKQGLLQHLNMAAAISAARIDPQGTRKKLDAGEWNLTAEQRQTAINKADTEFRAARVEDAYLRNEQERIRTEKDGDARDKQFAAIMGGTATRRAIMDDADLKPATREHLIDYMEHRAKELNTQEKKSDQVTLRDLWLRIHSDESDPRHITDGTAIFEAVKANLVNTTDANNLNTLVANQKDENGRTIGSKLSGEMSVVGRALSQDPQFTAQPALVAEIQMDYQARVLDKVKEYRDSKKNPNELFNPSNKDWVGSREFIQGSITAAKERVRAAMPKVPDLRADPNAWQTLKAGDIVINPRGVQVTVTQATLDKLKAESPTTPAAPQGPSFDGYIRTMPHSGSVTIDAPVRSPARALQGQTFESREAAVKALKTAYGEK